MSEPPDIAELAAAYEASEIDARRLVASLDEQSGTWRPEPGAWSVAECLDHLATGKRVYLEALRPAAVRARAEGRVRRGPARPGLIGGWFVWTFEPSATRVFKLKAPGTIVPRPSPPLSDAAAAFFDAHADLRAFLEEFKAIDLAGVRFRNPFVAAFRFSLATGLHVLAAHDRRHLRQAWNVVAAFADDHAASGSHRQTIGVDTPEAGVGDSHR
jgi:hypothetical protein